jgi:hypothetical protein
VSEWADVVQAFGCSDVEFDASESGESRAQFAREGGVRVSVIALGRLRRVRRNRAGKTSSPSRPPTCPFMRPPRARLYLGTHPLHFSPKQCIHKHTHRLDPSFSARIHSLFRCCDVGCLKHVSLREPVDLGIHSAHLWAASCHCPPHLFTRLRA